LVACPLLSRIARVDVKPTEPAVVVVVLSSSGIVDVGMLTNIT